MAAISRIWADKSLVAMQQQFAHDALVMVEYGDSSAVLVLGDSEAGLLEGRACAERAGFRVIGLIPFAEGLERLDRQAAVDAVWLGLEQDHGPALDLLLDRLDTEARADRYGSVISAPSDLIDVIARRATHERMIHICEAGEADRISAIRQAAERVSLELRDVGGEGQGRLRQLSEEVGRIADILAHLSEEVGRIADILAHLSEVEASERAARGADAEPIHAGEIRAAIRARRLRDHFFSADFFADPAWDMLLDLMAARLEQQRVAVSSLCIAAAVPPTTALRWIKTLTDHGLFVRAADPQDGRRVYIGLSDPAAAAMEAYLRAARRISPFPL